MCYASGKISLETKNEYTSISYISFSYLFPYPHLPVPLGSGLKMRDSLWDGLTDQHVGTPMGITAENLAEKYGITREVCIYKLNEYCLFC